MTVMRPIFPERNGTFRMENMPPQIQSVPTGVVMDFTRHLTPDYVTGTRASNATWFDAGGTLQTAGTNVARFDHNPSVFRRNEIRNGDGVGAVAGVVGAGGNFPTNWNTNSSAGLSREIIGTFVVNGISVTRIRVSGTANASTTVALFAESNTQIPAANGQTWTGSLYLSVQSGTIPTPVVAATGRTAAGATNENTLTPISPNSSLTRFVSTITMASGLTAFANVDFRYTVVNGVSYDFTIDVGGYQLETGAEATAYIPTTGSAVSVLQPRGLLIEGARTNLLLNSETLSTQSVTVTAVAHTLSFYGTGTVTLSGASTAGPLVGSGAFPNRNSLTFTPSAGTLTLTVTGSVQFANLEPSSSFASSYIPTTGAAATRTEDRTNITNLSTIGFNPLEGTLIVEFEPNTVQTNFGRIATFNDTTTNNTIELQANATNWRFFMINGGVTQFTLTGPAMSAGVRKFAIAYKAGDFGFSVDGDAAVTTTTGTIPTVSQLTLGYVLGGSYQGWYRNVTYIPTRLSNAELQARTA